MALTILTMILLKMWYDDWKDRKEKERRRAEESWKNPAKRRYQAELMAWYRRQQSERP